MSKTKEKITEVKVKEIIKKLSIHRDKAKKYILVFLLKEQNTYTIRKKKRFDPTNNKIRYKKRLHIIDTNTPTFTRKQKLFFCIDINKGQLFFKDTSIKKDKNNETKTTIEQDKEFLDLTIGTILIEKLSSGLIEKVNVKNIFEKILYIGFGISIGIIIGMML